MSASTTSILDAAAARRSVYQLTKSSPVPDSKLLDIVHHAARHVPSAFDSQTTRQVVLFGSDHEKLWDIVWSKVSQHVKSEEQAKMAKGRVDAFRGAHGTVMFFEDRQARSDIPSKIPHAAPYADKYAQWGEHTNAMHQYLLWLAFEAEGLGANLQHYNGLIDDEVVGQWGLSKDWVLTSQLVFGGLPEGKKVPELAKPKDMAGRENSVKVFGA